MKKIIYLLLLFVGCNMLFTACDDKDDDPQSNSWFANKQFTAEPEDWYISGIDWWVLSMDGNSGPGYDGHFTVRAYDDDGRPMSGIESYSGKYQVDYENNRLFITYDGYSANAVWTFGDEVDQDCWPFWKPNRCVSVPASATGQLAGLVFHSGYVFDAPDYDE